MSRNREIGIRGEEIAAALLAGRGMTVIARNWFGRRGELDLVALDDTSLRIVEVKSRMRDSEETIADSLGKAKLQAIQRTAQEYIAANNIDFVQDIYFDLVTVVFEEDGSCESEYIPGFFYPRW